VARGRRAGDRGPRAPHGLRPHARDRDALPRQRAGHTARRLGHADAEFAYSRYHRRFSALPGERERVEALIGGSVSGLAEVLDITAVA